MDFFKIKERCPRKGVTEIYPDFRVCKSKDLMIRGKSFYAVWDEEAGLWSTDEYDVQRLVDKELGEYRDRMPIADEAFVKVLWMSDFSTNSWTNFKNYISKMPDNSVQLDERLTFADTVVTKKDYVSKRLGYSLKEGDISAYEKLCSELYDNDERAKLEWAIGAIISGDARDIQKFVVLYGEAGTGKSTILNIIQQLFGGYYVTFDARALTTSGNGFALETFRSNPLVAIQHDGDLSRIEDNTRLNSIVSHEYMTMNEKYKSSYMARANCFLFMGTNKPVKITDAKSGLIRRLIDVRPSGRKLPPEEYFKLMDMIPFELGAIAWHCLKVYEDMGKNYYSSYKPLEMMLQTDVFFNFVEDSFHVFKEQDGVSLKQAYEMYKEYCNETAVEFKLPRYKFRDELRNYFKEFSEVARVDGGQVRSYYSGFKSDKFKPGSKKVENDGVLSSNVYHIRIESKRCESFSKLLAECPAQLATGDGRPSCKWSSVTTRLKDIDESKVHYVKPPKNLIVLDFDLKNEKGEKDLDKNLEAASRYPPTYTEVSQGGHGIHLHYLYDGDVSSLASVISPGIEIKRFLGGSSLRRRLTKCNDIPVATINSGLPLKEKKMINKTSVKSERALRDLIARNLRKEILPGTKPSVDFINKILNDAYEDGLHYDVSDMFTKVLSFASNSTHHRDYCVEVVSKMKFKSEEPSLPEISDKDELVFFDVEVFPNLLLVCWKFAGEGKKVVRMINPKPSDIEELMKFKLIGFNCRRYDNHIIYAAYLGWTNEEIFELSKKIVNDKHSAHFFGEAYNISYTDVYDFASAGHKQSLKKFEIEMGIHHKELGYPWDQPVPEDKWEEVAAYCDNDVIATEATFNYLKGDWAARQILAELSGLTVNDTTNQHSTRIIFGDNKHPQDQFNYTDLSEMFPGYSYEAGKSSYHGEDPGEGGYVYAEPGMYNDVALLDVASMHPTSIEQLNLFGPYTEVFSHIKQARIAIKHKDREQLKDILNGKLVPFYDRAMNGEFSLTDLSNALKTVINSVYGLTSARFDNPFRDPRNKDNIVAKRGALFMIDLKYAVQQKGYTVAHIKTDSIKIPNADQDIIDFVMEFGKKYGYNFEHEETYEKMCLVNDAVYIAKTVNGEWTATGAQFAQPYIFKTLFTKEPIEFKDMCETRSTKDSLYLDMNESLPEGEHNYVFVGKTGLFTPVREGFGGGELLREKEGKYYAVGGTKGYRWMETEVLLNLGKEEWVNENYYVELTKEAKKNIAKYGDAEWFCETDDYSDIPVTYCNECKANGTSDCNLCIEAMKEED